MAEIRINAKIMRILLKLLRTYSNIHTHIRFSLASSPAPPPTQSLSLSHLFAADVGTPLTTSACHEFNFINRHMASCLA